MSRSNVRACAFHLCDLLCGSFDRLPRRVGGREEGVAISQGERLAGAGRAGIHDDRSRATIRFWFGANASKLEELSIEVEIFSFRPGPIEDVDPFLRECVARFMIALLDPEHLELAFIPAGNDVEPEATFADLVAGDAFLGRDDGIEQRGMDGTEYGDALGRG